MKIRILDRILVAVAGLIILAVCAGVVAQVFFGIDVAAKVAGIVSAETQWSRIAIGAVAAFLFVIGLYCLFILFRHRSRKDKFILQKMESGDLSISLKALETMVTRCLDQYKEIDAQNVRLENQRDGLLIRIRGTVASGISIPLTVDTLQKQIKQYVVACSGVEVKGIRVEIESSGEEAKDAPFAIDGPAPTPLLHSAEKKAEVQDETAESADGSAQPEAVTEEVKGKEDVSCRSAADAALEAVETLKKEYEDDFEDNRPIHQRIFSTPEEPCIMPLPPEDLSSQTEKEEDLSGIDDNRKEVSDSDQGPVISEESCRTEDPEIISEEQNDEKA